MTPSERTAKIAELRAEAGRLEREGKTKENAKNGDLFRSYGRVVLIPPSYPNTYAIALTGEAIGRQCYGWNEDPNLEYLGHARDLLTIKIPDAPEPTGADLVGKVCELYDAETDAWYQCEVKEYNKVEGYMCSCSSKKWWPKARLAKGRP